ncbi:MAG: hypothetical protein H6709_15965 [Kofleriaceae bacterium]|nr:hypothetical protein [Kofleriaceae bacterium]
MLAHPALTAAQSAKGKAPAKTPKGAKAPPVDVAAEQARLDGADAKAAADAAARLGTSADPAAHDALLDALATGVDPDVAVAALRAVAMHPGKDDLAVVGYYAHYRDDQVRAAAAAALGALGGVGAHKAVIAALHDDSAAVRAAAAGAVTAGKIKEAAEPLLQLLAKGDPASAKALAVIADVELARFIGEQLGQVPDGLLAECLGAILMRPDFGNEAAKLQVVRALGKVAGPEATQALADYVSATPEKPPRQSRREAEAMVESRLEGGE